MSERTNECATKLASVSVTEHVTERATEGVTERATEHMSKHESEYATACATECAGPVPTAASASPALQVGPPRQIPSWAGQTADSETSPSQEFNFNRFLR